MKFSDRFSQLAKEHNLSVYQMAELFGVSHQVMYSWIHGLTTPRFEFQQTLARFEREVKPSISPRVSETTTRLFLGVSV